MNWRTPTLEAGEQYGKLTVLHSAKDHAGRTVYRVGCTCGHSGLFYTANQLMRGKVKSCRRCK